MLTEQDVKDRLEAAIEANGGLRRFAELHGLSPSFVSGARHGNDPLGPKILAALGVERLPAAYRIIKRAA